jgi:hypoxanthine phosphoribosyltransferase
MNFISTSKKGSDAVDTRKWLLIPVEQIDAPKYAKIGIEGILITEGRVRKRVRKNAAEIKVFYHAKKIDEIYAIGVLKGASRILNELTTELGRGEDGMSAEIDYTELRSYEKDKSTGDVKLVKDLSGSIRRRHVLVIEDILDTGATFSYLLNHIEAKNPAS